MIKYFLLLVLISFTLPITNAQERYLEPITDEIIIQTLTYVSKEGENLDLDIYMPDFDPENERVTIIFVHGGGFQEGQRDSKNIQKFCTSLAEYGYVVASISYRLTRKGKAGGFGCDCPAGEKLTTFDMAVEDLQDAAFFLIQNREEFGIDPQKIVLAGSSAGAETVLMAAYQPPNCYDLESGPVSYAGVIGMAGAIPDTTRLYNESAVPSLLFHGTDDNLVPYATAPHHYCSEEKPGHLVLYGSYAIAERLSQLEVPFWLHTTCGAGHEMADKPMTEYFNEIVDFCYTFVVKNERESRTTIIEGTQNNKYQPYNFCER
jgi:acetyl esterase/lipase